ncbi:adhesin [Paraburkholderia sp. 1N]|uniref:Adhesin n=1 Tax=Paraburkholderia solitsugae TaxID=2675748 RepID=A0ABX2BT97_9BURK|nr:YadA-like family protein [Paraburkholderia solitsugae]NPT43986.1 adhesin [Paraburkholderia solitsugae]
MNKIYKSVWCEATGTWVATSETARSKTKRGGSGKLAVAQAVLAAATLMGGASVAYADPVAAANYFDAKAVDPTVDRNALAAGSASVAAGANAGAMGNGSTAIGNASWTTKDYATAVGDLSSAFGEGATALGTRATANGSNSVALGYSATATTDNSVALGANSTTTLAPADLTKQGYTPLGVDPSAIAGATATGEVSVGSAGNERRVTNVAAGAADTDAVNVSQLKAVDSKIATATANSVQYDATPTDKSSVTLAGPASTDGGVTGGTTITNVHQGAVSATSTDAVNGAQLYAIAGDTSSTYVQDNGNGVKYVRTNDNGLTPDDAHATASGASAVGYNAQAGGVNSVAIGYQGIASEGGAIAVGAGSSAQSENSVAFGANSQAIGSQAGAFGTNAYAFGAGSVALGANATANSDNSVALGQDSVADRTNTVSVGSSAQQRQITNVADGTAGTDAVNVRQLQAAITAATPGETRYFKANGNNDGTDDATATGTRAVAMGAAAEASGTNAFAGGNSSLASGTNSVAVGNKSTANGDDSVAIGANSVAGHDPLAIDDQGFTAATAVGSDAQAIAQNATALGNLATAGATNSVALGQGAVVNADASGSVALGQGSIADRVNTVSVGSAGKERQITNVAAGVQGTDAVNVNQLNAVADQGAATAAKLDGAVMYDTNPDGSVNKNSVTLGDAASGGTLIHNVADGVDPTDAVNLGQLNAAIGNAVQNITVNPNVPFFSADGDVDTEGAQASGTHSVAVGANANATGTNAIAMGANSVASGNNATALGASANASADNSVALGQGSVADRANTVSVGAAGQERQMTNVAAGVQGTDAVNVNQLQQSVSGAVGQAKSYTDDQIRSARRDSYGGTASALAAAGLPQAVLPGHGMVAIAGGTYGGQTAMAIGVSQLSETGKWVYKVQGTSDSRGQFGASIGAGMHW